MDILKFPNPSLSTVCEPVTVFGPELKILLESMYETMKAAKGIGLAANQVGLKFRMFVMEGPSGEKMFLVNPIISKQGLNLSNYKEGCLSAPGEILFTGSRTDYVQIRYKDETGKEFTRDFTGIHSVCVQHEIEHLKGENFMKSKMLSREKRKFLAKKWGLKGR